MPAVSRIDPRTVFTPDEWAGLTRRSPWMGFALVAHAWALIIGAGVMFIAWPNPATFVLAVMVIGARQLGLAILMHDGAHGALHPDAKVNEFIGEWLCAAPVGSNLQTYRKYHLKHHRYTEQPEDPDLMLSRPFPITRQSLWRKVVRDMTGRTFYRQRFAGLFAKRKSGLKKALFLNETRKRFLAFNAVLLLALSLAGYWWAFFALWLLPMATWMQLIVRIRNIGEHAVVHATEDPFHHARTTLANPVERLLVAPYWVHFHAEHHLFMHVPCWNLEKAHRLLMEKGYGPRMVLSDGYGDVLSLAAPA
jgi:fatty acid desaturase